MFNVIKGKLNMEVPTIRYLGRIGLLKQVSKHKTQDVVHLDLIGLFTQGLVCQDETNSTVKRIYRCEWQQSLRQRQRPEQPRPAHWPAPHGDRAATRLLTLRRPPGVRGGPGSDGGGSGGGGRELGSEER